MKTNRVRKITTGVKVARDLLEWVFGKRRRCSARRAQAKICGSIATVMFLFVAVTLSRAQSYFIDWFTIDGGGGMSTGGVYSVSSTIGQPDAGAMSGGNFSIHGGFWAILAVQTPGAPLLTISRSQTNTVIVSWPSPSIGFSLQQSSDLSTAVWNVPTESVTDNGTNKFIIVNPTTGNRFYRLCKP